MVIYTPLSQCENYFTAELSKILDQCWGSYENTVILGDFNMQPANQILETFLEDNTFVNLMKSNTCFKSKPRSCIYLILTNKPKSPQNSRLMVTGIGDDHALIFSFLKTTFTKILPKKFQYRNYKKYEVHSFYKMLNNCPKKLVIPNEKKIFWKR